MLIVIPFSNKGHKIVTPRNVIATLIAYIISTLGYYLAEYLLFGTWSVFLVSVISSSIQSLGSAMVFIIFGIALDKARVKAKFFINS